MLDKTDERVIAWKESVQKYEKRRIEVDAAEQLALKSIFRDIENAYTNYQVKAMSQAIANMSNRVDFVQDQLFSELNGGVERFLVERFLQGTFRQQFDVPAEFERFLAAHTKIALFWGDCLCRRNEYGLATLLWIEYRTFEVLKKFADKFLEEGRDELAAIARKFLDAWTAHIESDGGLIRRLAYYHLDMSWPLIELGKITPERARIGARGDAITLIRLGYTPKWLDEFFDADELAMKSIYHDIENAYTNDQAEAMILAMGRMPVRFGRAKIRPPFELDLAFRRLFNDRFDFRQFCSVSKLERFLAANTEMARFLCSSGYEDTSYELEQLEFKTFKILRQYVDKFHADGKTDFEKVAQKFLDLWVEFLESDQGVAHRFARTIRERYVKEGRWTREGALENVRSRIHQYIQLGYTPKWLDEFK